MTTLNLNLSNDLFPEETYNAILNEDRILFVWEEGFEENSETMNVLREWYGMENADNHCVHANLGGRYDHTIFISNGSDALLEAKDLIDAGEYSYIILTDRTLEDDPSCYPLIHNKALQQASC
ncbi:hypothetical protein WJ0W_006675 [Paenibacillus melissococcoides]|uniref:Uncharacterized protein n=1 Tax=Paenibacillus melissococcoides TaxID=2912268 RepID=A0ABN8UE45_9BACL|nr:MULTISPECIES: hypothetical protein [Paenibacillus]MEB9895714.1 hypothetical protein [Bacillus cereus]GIO81556.1 hypothetical protein J6TS7_51660 [Paenibacillus dendritiformis]CAH8249490.1 hypothetical protein WJ0W_006675 [Paenibacillus melissococcoides]CAH8721207.1 hypothetical protein HTL2_006243 [Paenibacillus melissococcoides]